VKSARGLLRTLLLVQLGAAILIAWLAAARLGMASWQAALLGIACVVLVRLLINANNFVLAACFAGATPPAYRLGVKARLRLLAGEFAASMLQTSWFVPRASAATRIHPSSRHPPVLLLHGYGCNSGYWVRWPATSTPTCRWSTAPCASCARRVGQGGWRSSPTAWAGWSRAPTCARTGARAWRA
jgi:hypothetical protein